MVWIEWVRWYTEKYSGMKSETSALKQNSVTHQLRQSKSLCLLESLFLHWENRGSDIYPAWMGILEIMFAKWVFTEDIILNHWHHSRHSMGSQGAVKSLLPLWEAFIWRIPEHCAIGPCNPGYTRLDIEPKARYTQGLNTHYYYENIMEIFCGILNEHLTSHEDWICCWAFTSCFTTSANILTTNFFTCDLLNKLFLYLTVQKKSFN